MSGWVKIAVGFLLAGVFSGIGFTAGQFVTTDVAQTIIAQHTFNPATVLPPFLLGANAANQKVPNFNADVLDGEDGSAYHDATLLTGTAADARLSTNVPLKNAANVFTLPQTLSPTTVTPPLVLGANALNQKVIGLNADQLEGQEGAFYQNATNTNAGTLADARLSTNIPLKNAANVFTAQQQINPSTGVPPFVLNANAQNRKVVGLEADRLDGEEAANFQQASTARNAVTDVAVVKVGSEAITNSIVLQADDHLFLPITTGAWAFQFNVAISDPAANGTILTLKQGTGLTGCAITWGLSQGYAIPTAFNTTIAVSGSSVFSLAGGVRNCVGSGNIELWWSPNVVSATPVTMIDRSSAWAHKDM